MIFSGHFLAIRMFIFGNIHVLRKHKGGEGGGQPNAYYCLRGGRGSLDHCLRNHIYKISTHIL